MLAHKGAYLLNVIVDETDNVFPMVPPGGKIDEILISRTQKFSPNVN